jgi:hypothetical protein
LWIFVNYCNFMWILVIMWNVCNFVFVRFVPRNFYCSSVLRIAGIPGATLRREWENFYCKSQREILSSFATVGYLQRKFLWRWKGFAKQLHLQIEISLKIAHYFKTPKSKQIKNYNNHEKSIKKLNRKIPLFLHEQSISSCGRVVKASDC